MPQGEKGYRRRNSLRHVAHDYSAPGAYFVTLCVYRRRCVFGQVVAHAMVLTPLGQLAQDGLVDFGKRQAALVTVDAAVVMPNHVHLLLWLGADPDHLATVGHNKPRQFGNAVAGSLSTLIGGYKNSVTQRAKNRGFIPGPPLWQDNLHDHIVRDDASLVRIRHYIQTNPMRWLEDQLHPDAPPNRFNHD